jgi:glycyl-radical enzyme activating protein
MCRLMVHTWNCCDELPMAFPHARATRYNPEMAHDIGMIFDIQRFSIHDGPGIRTTVFLKGCPLRCLWCHNPESQDAKPEISFIGAKCIGCGRCIAVCPTLSQGAEEGIRVYHRDTCRRCGACAEECYTNALELIGKRMSTDEVIEQVMRDEPFYKNSGGGLTLSGGEPLAQFDFAKTLLSMAKGRGLHTAIETSGFAPAGKPGELVDLVDLWLFDVKETDPDLHRTYVGVDRARIVDNLFDLDSRQARILLRCPIVPGLNDRDDHLASIADLANRLENVEAVDVLPYHPLGRDKSERLGRSYELAELGFTPNERVEAWVTAIASRTEVPVRRS